MYRLRVSNQDDLQKVFDWRNKPEVRSKMYTTHEITWEEHVQWFERISKDLSKKHLIFQYDGTPIGVVYFTDIDPKSRTATWAYYLGEPGPRGSALFMEFHALQFAFEDLALQKLSCEVLDINPAVVKIHRKFGFNVEGRFAKHKLINEQLCDVYRLAMFQVDWKTHLKDYCDKMINFSLPEGPKVGDRFKFKLDWTESSMSNFFDMAKKKICESFQSKDRKIEFTYLKTNSLSTDLRDSSKLILVIVSKTLRGFIVSLELSTDRELVLTSEAEVFDESFL